MPDVLDNAAPSPAPASTEVSTDESTTNEFQERLTKATPAEREEWLRTDKLPERKPAAAPSGDVPKVAPVPGPESTSEEDDHLEDGKSYSKADVQRFIQKRVGKEVAKRHQLDRDSQAEIANLRRQLDSKTPASPAPTPAPAPAPKELFQRDPQTGRPLRPDWETFQGELKAFQEADNAAIEALAEWKFDQRSAQAKAQAEQREKQTAAEKLQSDRASRWETQATALEKEHQDFNDVILAGRAYFTPTMLEFFGDDPQGVAAAYALSSNLAELQRVSKLPENQQLITLARLVPAKAQAEVEQEVVDPATQPKHILKNQPPPPPNPSARPGTVEDPQAAAAKRGDFRAWSAEEDKRELARRRGY